MKALPKKTLIGLTCLGLGATATAESFLTIGDNIALAFKGSAEVKYDTNIFLDQDNEESDMIYMVSPGLEVNLGKEGRTTGFMNLTFREDIARYGDNSDLDDELANLAVDAGLDAGVADFSSSLNARNVRANTRDSNAQGLLIESDQIDFNNAVDFAVSAKTKVGIGINYNEINYITAGYTDHSSVTVPVDVFYALTPKMDLSVGYRYRDTNTDGSNDYEDNFYNLGVHNELAPKLTGSLRLGFQKRDYSVGGNTDGFSMIADLAYELTAKANLSLNLSKDYDASSTGDSVERTSANAVMSYQVDTIWSIYGSLFYENADYANSSNREDDFYAVGAGVRYMPNDIVSVIASYGFNTNDSTIDGSDFDSNIFSVKALLRY